MSRRSNGFLIRRDSRAAWAGLIMLLVLIVPSAVTLPQSMRWFNVQDLEKAVRHVPSYQPVISAGGFGSNEATSSAMDRAAFNASSWLGHDDLGRSLLFRLMPGFLISLGIGGVAALMAVVIGTAWGCVAGLSGGRLDSAMMRIVDVLYGLPYILMVILLKTALTRPLTSLLGGQHQLASVLILLVAIGGVSWLTMARVVRGQVLSLKSQAFVEASRAAGAGSFFIIRQHLFPNLIGPIAVYATLVVPQAILQESFLSFLGIGVQQPVPTLGRLAADGVQAVNTFVGYWWLIVYPCAVLVATLLSLNFIGDSLRDRFDPKSSVISFQGRM